MPTISLFLNLNVHEIYIQTAHDAPCLFPSLARRRVYLHNSVETPEAMRQFYLVYLPVKLKYTTQGNEERCDAPARGVTLLGPSQFLSPFFGRGLLHDLVRTCSPYRTAPSIPPTSTSFVIRRRPLLKPSAKHVKLSQNPKSDCVKSGSNCRNKNIQGRDMSYEELTGL